MRTTGKAALAAVAALSIGLTGCSGDKAGPGTGASAGASGATGTTGTGPSGGASTGASGDTNGTTGGGQGTVASCLVGSWKATSITGKLTGPVGGDFTGGGGTMLTIDSGGKTIVDFGAMQPVTFTFSVSGNAVKGSFSYGGKVNGAVKSPSGTTGTLEPSGSVDFSTLTVTVDLTAPVAQRVADKVSIAEFAGTGTANTGGAVDAQPILKKSQYECGSGTLKLSPPAGETDTGTWTFTKA
ncbi:hypothetical protein [Dactylosporangium matsuzakiense]|uniref:Lipoprotein n=1 Tax=Dactylosporangium matsuzakiense TaxID=53360 RepID=A0A9W6KEQ6_9ACTN|nr:hypothetical protein [Dactylosporangium matsuzakiense]UWZ44308.1 hypothetical protein Dmats_44220 [Dactylosporangium matsuzakiense]GLK99541.1 hypothetical protein GCM10017581_012820 [Dactylosporangium matsuzakiense]